MSLVKKVSEARSKEKSFVLPFLGGSDGKEFPCNAGDLGLIPELGRIAWRRKRQPTPVFWPGESYGLRCLVGYSLEGRKESDTTEQLKTTNRIRDLRS